MSKINEALSLTKELHKYSIVNDDSYYSDKLLQIIINLSTLNESKLVEDNNQNYQDEIAKVKRKVPKWMKKTHQYNYLILKAFMDLSDNNTYRVGVDELEKHVDIGQVFLANYNNLKTISEKNHGKIFDEIDREVELWEPVAEFIEGVFEEYEMKNSDNIINANKPIYLFQDKEYINGGKDDNSFRYLVLDVIKKYLNENNNKSYQQLQDKFNSLHTSKVIFSEEDYNQWLNDGNENKTKRYFDEPVIYNEKKYYILTQWGHDKNYDRLGEFINFARNELGYNIREI